MDKIKLGILFELFRAGGTAYHVVGAIGIGSKYVFAAIDCLGTYAASMNNGAIGGILGPVLHGRVSSWQIAEVR